MPGRRSTYNSGRYARSDAHSLTMRAFACRNDGERPRWAGGLPKPYSEGRPGPLKEARADRDPRKLFSALGARPRPARTSGEPAESTRALAPRVHVAAPLPPPPSEGCSARRRVSSLPGRRGSMTAFSRVATGTEPRRCPRPGGPPRELQVERISPASWDSPTLRWHVGGEKCQGPPRSSGGNGIAGVPSWKEMSVGRGHEHWR